VVELLGGKNFVKVPDGKVGFVIPMTDGATDVKAIIYTSDTNTAIEVGWTRHAGFQIHGAIGSKDDDIRFVFIITPLKQEGKQDQI
jgi:hypothetical protein